MRRHLAVAFALLALGLAAPALGRGAPRCSFPNTTPVSSDSVGTTFTLPFKGNLIYGACLYANGVPRFLVRTMDDKPSPDWIDVELAQMHGPYVVLAGVLDDASLDAGYAGDGARARPADAASTPSTGELTVFDVRRGTAESLKAPIRFHGKAAVDRTVKAQTNGTPIWASVALQSDGGVAFIQWDPFTSCDGSGQSDATGFFAQVCAWGPKGAPYTLDTATNIVPNSLTLRGTTLLWHDGEQVRSATLR